MSLKAKMLIIGIIGSVAIILISLLGTLIYYDKIEKDQILKSVKSARHNFDVALDSKKDVWQTNALQIATSNDVKIALYFQDRDRANRILQTIGETFKKNTGFRNVQIHLIDKNLTSFYKSWAPDRFGEKLSHSAGYRIIRETKKNIAAMEVSEKGLRLKGLFPVYFKEEFVGIANFEGGLNSIKRSMEPYNVEFLYFMDESSTDIAKGMAGKPMISNFILNQNDFNKDFFDYVKNNGIIGKINSEGFYIDKNYLVITNRFKDFEEKDVGLYVLGMKTDVVMETVGSIKKIFFSLFSFITLVFLTLIIGLIVFMNVKAIKPIFGISDHMHESAEQVLEAANRLSSICSSVAQGTGYQSQSINQTSSSIEEISAMTKNNTENSGFANQLMGETNSVIIKANESMTKLTTSMNEISKASEETSKIIKTIDEIAFQTNLLALNAAVEAARAGEAGAGFAVVADEVRNLSMRAAQAAKDTEMMIQGTIKKVYDGATLVNETSKAFSNVAESSGKIGEIVSDIAVASKEQSTGIEQVNRAINEMDTFIKENSANAESSASSAEEMNAQAKQLQKYVRELASLLTGKTGHMEISARKYKAAEKGLRHSIPDMRSSYNTEIKPDQIIKIGKKRY